MRNPPHRRTLRHSSATLLDVFIESTPEYILRQVPILSAGMNVAAGPELCAAVTNAGGMGVLGGLGYSPKNLRAQLRELKAGLKDPNGPFGVDLALPSTAPTARKTNYDYTHGQLDQLIDVIIDEKAKAFVSAVGVAPASVIQRLQGAGVVCCNMVGAPRHAKKALDLGYDVIIGQGGEGGGHSGSVATSLLIPELVQMCRGYISPLTGKPIQVLAGGGIYRGSSLAAMLTMGATGVWVGTRFVASEEAGASKAHKNAIISAKHGETVRTLIYSGRPLRVYATPFVKTWEQERRAEIKEKVAKGVIPVGTDLEDPAQYPFLMGSAAAVIEDILPAHTIMEDMVREAIECLRSANACVRAKL